MMVYTKEKQLRQVATAIEFAKKVLQRQDKLSSMLGRPSSFYDDLLVGLRKKPTVKSLKANDVVYHKTFGEGRVLSVDKPNARIRIHFSLGDKLFQYPMAFDKGYLSLDKPERMQVRLVAR